MRELPKLMTQLKTLKVIYWASLTAGLMIFLLISPCGPQSTLRTMFALYPQGISWDTFTDTQQSIRNLSAPQRDTVIPSQITEYPLFLDPAARKTLLAAPQTSAKADTPRWRLTQLIALPYRYQWEGYAVATDGTPIAMIVDTHTRQTLRARPAETLAGTAIMLDHIELYPEPIAHIIDTEREHALILPLRQIAYTDEWEAVITSEAAHGHSWVLTTQQPLTTDDAKWSIIQVNKDTQTIQVEKRCIDSTPEVYVLHLETTEL